MGVTRSRRLRRVGAALALLAFVVSGFAVSRMQADWRSASRAPVGLAPDPATTPEAVVQVYAARTVGWRGVFAVHTWIAAKPEKARVWTVYEVIGWRLRWGDTALAVHARAPDARWFGAEPELVAQKRGRAAQALIARIDRAARAYPYARHYSAWPGPNSNTFTAYVLRAVPELEADLPPTAIGKDYLGERFVAKAPSGSGVQLSVYGLLGVIAAPVEGLEVDLLGLSFGLSPRGPALKLPLLGRLGPAPA